MQKPSIDQYRIKSTDEIKDNEYITRISGTNKFSKGNISAWTGAAKSKKTFAMTMLVSSMLSGTTQFEKFYSYKLNKVLWIDTEQSPADVQRVIKRIVEIVGDEKNVFMYGLRPLTPKERIEAIEQLLETHKGIDVLIIDGARDLLMNINDPVESTEVVTKIMKWSYDYHIHISTVVHQASGGLKVRGHIGTELENKAETVIQVKRNDTDINYSEIKEVFGRGKGFEAFEFYIDQNGIPVVESYSESMSKTINTFEETETPF